MGVLAQISVCHKWPDWGPACGALDTLSSWATRLGCCMGCAGWG